MYPLSALRKNLSRFRDLYRVTALSAEITGKKAAPASTALLVMIGANTTIDWDQSRLRIALLLHD